jgi:hypothetical protein
VNPKPADYRCCVSGHPSALLTNFFSFSPAAQMVAADVAGASLCPSGGDAILTVASPPGGPPGVLNLRI